MRKQLLEKLHPLKVKGYSNKMYFIISRIMDTTWVTHPDAWGPLTVTSDGFVQCGSLFIGTADELQNNLSKYTADAGLTIEEQDRFDIVCKENIADWRKYCRKALA
jgi:hypothetical protein